MKKERKAKRVNRWIYWIPRIFSILFVLFLGLFSLDVFDSCQGFDCLLGLLMHNIPAILLLILVIIAWKWEWVGGIFILFGIGYVAMTAINVEWYLAISWGITIAGPAIIIGVLWILNWVKKK